MCFESVLGWPLTHGPRSARAQVDVKVFRAIQDDIAGRTLQLRDRKLEPACHGDRGDEPPAAGPTCSAYARWNQPELGAEAIGPLEVVPGTPQKYPATAIPRGRSLELREGRAGTSLGPSRTPSRRRPPRPTAQAVPGDEDRQCVGPIGSQSARQTPQPFVRPSELTRTPYGLGALLSDDTGCMSRTTDQKFDAAR